MILRFTRVACTSSSALLFAEYILWGGHLCARSVAQPYPTLCDLMDYNPPGSPVHGISQARVLEWITTHFSRESLQPKNQTFVSRIGRQALYHWATAEAHGMDTPHFIYLFTS